MKYLLLFLIAFNVVSVFAIGQYGCYFLGIDPSSSSLGIGGRAVGVVNIWQNNPLNTYFNPSIAAFHEGLSYGNTSIKWMKSDEIPDMHFNSGIMNLGYYGVSLILPAPNAGSKLGTNFNYGAQELTNASGEAGDTFHPYEDASLYGFAVNPLEVMRHTSSLSPLLNHFDFAFGFNHVSVKSKIYPSSMNQEVSAEASCINFGLIGKYSIISEDFKYEAVYGYSYFNIQGSHISYINENESDPLFSHRNQGLALSMSCLAKGKISHLVDNFYTIRALSSYINDDYDANIYGYGAELGLLDTFFVRGGKYEDQPGHVMGNTFGFGINLHYKNLVSLAYNNAQFPLGDLKHVQRSHDFSASFDLLGLYNLSK